MSLSKRNGVCDFAYPVFVCHAHTLLIGWESRTDLGDEELLAKGKDVYREVESEGSS